MLSTKTKENQTGRLIVVGIGVTPGEGRDHVPGPSGKTHMVG